MKIVLIIITLLLALFILGCNNNNNVSSNSDELYYVIDSTYVIPYSIDVFYIDDNTPLEILELKSYLIDKYNPGHCFGEPTIDLYDREKIIKLYPRIANYVIERFGVNSEYNIFSKMRQISEINVTQNDDAYKFYLSDGRCCDIISIHGILYFNEDVIIEEVLSTKVESVPC